jgi:hypothetical protein
VEVDLGGEAWDELEVYLHAYGSSYEPQTCKVEARMGGAGGELKTVATHAGSAKLAKSGGWTSVGKADASTAGATSLRFSNHESDGGGNIKLASMRVKKKPEPVSSVEAEATVGGENDEWVTVDFGAKMEVKVGHVSGLQLQQEAPVVLHAISTRSLFT